MPGNSGPTIPITEIAATYWPVLACSFAVALLTTPLCRILALRVEAVDRPDDWLKPHAKPIPYLGGLAIYAGWLAGMVFAMIWLAKSSAGNDIHLDGRLMAGVLIGGTLIMAVGLFDDLHLASPRTKIVFEVIVAVILLCVGLGGNLLGGLLPQLHQRLADDHSWLLRIGSAPLAIFIVVGCCNATNLLDGLDGLCGGVLSIISLGFLVLAVHMHTHAHGWTPDTVQRMVVPLAILGAALGFLPFNHHPARIFMGDAGSTLLGFSAAVMILMFGEAETIKWMLGALVVFGLPIGDTLLAMLRRRRAGRPIFAGDRSHFYDQLRDRGHSVPKVVAISYILAAVFAAVGSLSPIFLRTRYLPLVFGGLAILALVAVRAFRMVRVDGPETQTAGNSN